MLTEQFGIAVLFDRLTSFGMTAAEQLDAVVRSGARTTKGETRLKVECSQEMFSFKVHFRKARLHTLE